VRGLILRRRSGESIEIRDAATGEIVVRIHVPWIGRRACKLQVDAPRNRFTILRSEITYAAGESSNQSEPRQGGRERTMRDGIEPDEDFLRELEDTLDNPVPPSRHETRQLTLDPETVREIDAALREPLPELVQKAVIAAAERYFVAEVAKIQAEQSWPAWGFTGYQDIFTSCQTIGDFARRVNRPVHLLNRVEALHIAHIAERLSRPMDDIESVYYGTDEDYGHRAHNLWWRAPLPMSSMPYVVTVRRVQIRSTPWTTTVKVDAASPEEAMQRVAELLPSLSSPFDDERDDCWGDGEPLERLLQPAVEEVWETASNIDPVYESPEDAAVESLLARVADSEDRQLVREVLAAVKEIVGPFRIESI
jgi:sRNA-binding carbon storage regulator CsrA